MYEAFTKVDKFLKRKPKIHDPRPDNFVFRLHYQYTFTILAISVILVTSYTYIDSEGKTLMRETKSFLNSFTLYFKSRILCICLQNV